MKVHAAPYNNSISNFHYSAKPQSCFCAISFNYSTLSWRLNHRKPSAKHMRNAHSFTQKYTHTEHTTPHSLSINIYIYQPSSVRWIRIYIFHPTRVASKLKRYRLAPYSPLCGYNKTPRELWQLFGFTAPFRPLCRADKRSVKSLLYIIERQGEREV